MQQYYITKATPAKGDPDQYGNIAYWLEIEGVEGTALVKRKPESPILSGQVWGELTDQMSQRGTTYKKFSVKQAPQAPAPVRHHDEPYKADPDRQASIEWQSAVKAATEALRDYYTLTSVGPGKLEDYTQSIIDVAQKLATRPKEATPDPLPDAAFDPHGEINLDDIPF